MSFLYSRLLSRIDQLEQRLTSAAAEPKSKPDPKQTRDHIAEVSKNARVTWFALLGYLAFAVLALMSFTDKDFFVANAAIKLPFIGIEVPPIHYIWFAPPLLVAVHIYLHVHLMKLWAALPRLATHFGDDTEQSEEFSEHVYPWLIADFALRRGQQPLLEHHALSRIADSAAGFLAWFAVPMTLGWFWMRSMPIHNPWLTTILGLMLLLSVYASIVSFRDVILRLYPDLKTRAWSIGRWFEWGVRRASIITSTIVLTWISLETTIGLGSGVRGSDGSIQSLVAPINLRLAQLSEKPKDWLDYNSWLEEFDTIYRQRNGIESGIELTIGRTLQLIQQARVRRAREISNLVRPDFSGRRFNRSDFGQAFMAGINLSEADLSNAVLREANLEAADLRSARMHMADLGFAELQGAVLRGAEMQGAVLRGAEMQGAVLIGAEMQGADMQGADMQGADFSGAEMQGVDLGWAQMQGAYFGGAELQGANLGWAQMQGAYFGSAEMQGADLSGAEMQGADLSGAEMKDANCSGASLAGSLLQSANVTCLNLTQEQLEAAVGNSETVLPGGVTVASCLKSLPEDVEAALAHHPEEGAFSILSRAEFREALLCDPGEEPVRFPLPATPQQ